MFSLIHVVFKYGLTLFSETAKDTLLCHKIQCVFFVFVTAHTVLQ